MKSTNSHHSCGPGISRWNLTALYSSTPSTNWEQDETVEGMGISIETKKVCASNLDLAVLAPTIENVTG